MLRRDLLLAATLPALSTATRARAQSAPIELKASHYLPPSQTFHLWLEAWSQDIEKRSNGQLKIRIYPASQLGPVQRQFDLARNGQADMAIGLTGATPGRYPMTELTSLPFVHPAAGDSCAITSRRATELVPKYLASEYQGLRILWIGITPENTFFMARKEITAVSDLRGLKMRFQGEQNAKLLRLLGAVPLQVPPGEIADGMSKGVIDGAMFTYEAAEAFGIQPVTRHVMEPPFVTGSLSLAMNQARYDSLPPDLRALIDATTGPSAAEQVGRMLDAAELHGRDSMLAAKVDLHALPSEEVDKLRTALHPMAQDAVDALEKAGKPAAAMLKDYTA